MMRKGCADALRKMENVRFVPADESSPDEAGLEAFGKTFDEMFAAVSTVICRDRRIGIHRYDSEDGAFVHLLNYDYHEETDRVEEIDSLEVVLRDCPDGETAVYRLDGKKADYMVRREKDALILTIRDVPLYMVVSVLPSAASRSSLSFS